MLRIKYFFQKTERIKEDNAQHTIVFLRHFIIFLDAYSNGVKFYSLNVFSDNKAEQYY